MFHRCPPKRFTYLVNGTSLTCAHARKASVLRSVVSQKKTLVKISHSPQPYKTPKHAASFFSKKRPKRTLAKLMIFWWQKVYQKWLPMSTLRKAIIYETLRVPVILMLHVVRMMDMCGDMCVKIREFSRLPAHILKILYISIYADSSI